jgi:hypothetical protein
MGAAARSGDPTMADVSYIRSYEGVSWAQAYEWFRSDATLAMFDGWHPVSSSWEGGELRVEYVRGEPYHEETLWRGVARELARRSLRVLAPVLPWLALGAAVGAITGLVVGHLAP